MNFFTLFTGYGFIAAPITVALFGLQFFQDFRIRPRTGAIFSGFGLLGSFGSILIFMNGYVFYPSAGCSEIHLSNVVRFPFFSGASFARFVGLDVTELRWPTLILGVLLVAIFLGILGFQLFKLVTYYVSNGTGGLIK